ncbi:MAG TPA: ABC transporter substrate-binding protein [Usitatibacter sp.]|nr:ABC transporter substrate-binding protein [Usitatibacter sp.]
MTRIVYAALALALALPAHAASVKLGVVNSMTGPQAPIGESLTNGIKLAQEDLKKKGIDVQLVWEDDTGKPQVGLSALEKLATRDNVAGVVGAYTSAVTSAVAKAAERYKVPLLNPVASKEEITRQGYKWVFRLSATTGDYAAILLDMALSLGQPKTMAILNETTDFGVSGGKSARAYAEKKGIKVVFEEAYSQGSPDYRSTLVKLKNTTPDLVFMVSYVADAILLMRQSREIGLSPQAFLGAGAGFANSQFAKETDVSNGVFSSTQWTDVVPWPGAKDFATRYHRQFNKEATYHAATAYASMMILGEEAAKAGGDREKLRKQLGSQLVRQLVLK